MLKATFDRSSSSGTASAPGVPRAYRGMTERVDGEAVTVGCGWIAYPVGQ